MKPRPLCTDVIGGADPGPRSAPSVTTNRVHSVCTLVLLVVGLLASTVSPLRAATAPSIAIDWPQFLARANPQWNRVPAAWDDAAFLGNGLLGALIHTNDANELGWDIGRTDVTDHRDDPNPMFRTPRLPIGRMVLLPVGRIIGGFAQLDLWNAEARGVVKTDRGEIRWRSFVHTDEPVLVVTLETTGGEGDARWEWRPEVAVNPRKVFRRLPMGPADLNPAPVHSERGDARACVQPLSGGGEYATAWREQRDTGNLDRRTLCLSVGNTGKAPGAGAEALGTVDRATEQGVDALLSSHRAWWHAYYPQSFLSLPDTRLESFYWIQMYKLASATRADRPALDTLGPWWAPTPRPGIWWDMNIQVTYAPVYTANRLSIGESFTRLMDRNHDNFIRNAPKEFQHDSAAVGIATGQDARDDVDADPQSTISWAKPGYAAPGNLVWGCHGYWLHYRHTMDDTMLRERLYPLLTRAVNFYRHLLTRGADGKLHLPAAWSPEYPVRAADTNYDLALLRWGCQTLLAAAARLKIDDPLMPHWREILADLTPYPTNNDGLMIGRDVPFKVSHRHYSHLLAVYPLRLLTGDQRAERDLIERSLKHWTGLPGGLEGFALGGAAAMASHLGRGDDALRYLQTLLNRSIEANTLYRETGPVLETPLLAAGAIQEMMVQSWGGVIRVFPAVPRDWQDVAFHQFRTEGAFLVSAVRRTTATMWIQVTSLAGEPCRLKTDLKPPYKIRADRAFSPRTLPGGIVELDLRKGETVTLYAEDIALTFPVAPVVAESWRTNYYGSRAAADRALRVVKRQTRPASVNPGGAGEPPRAVADQGSTNKAQRGASKTAGGPPRAVADQGRAALHVVLVGDSTVTDGAGWGKAFADQLHPIVQCTNTSRGGQSTKSFLDAGLYTAALALKPTHVLIQFGHNDMPGKGANRETDPATTYRTNLVRYIDEAHAAGAQPILVSSVVRRGFRDGQLVDGLAPYAEAMKAVAFEKNVPLVDLHARSFEAVQRLGPEGSAELGPMIRTGNRDGTHLAPPGKLLTANLVFDELRRVTPEFARAILRPTDN